MFNTLLDYINNPIDPTNNFAIARYYDSINQTSAAISFYLRTAERATDDLIKYESLLHISNCFKRQGNRITTVENILLKAISLLPERLEGYKLLCDAYEVSKKWTDCYTMANIALTLKPHQPVIENIIIDRYIFIFMKALAAYWIGKFEESKQLFFEISLLPDINILYKNATINNLNNNGYPKNIKYSNLNIDNLKYKFPKLNTFRENQSETFQDMFVLTVLNGKEEGTYLELGCNHYKNNNNTYLLETVFNWQGLSVDIDCDLIELFNKNRKNKAICESALDLDYLSVLDKHFKENHIDYLQIDCDPPEISFAILKKIPFEKYNFSVITFEHDFYYNNEIRDLSRDYLYSKNYFLLVSDVCTSNSDSSYEDWWINTDFIKDYQRFISNNKYNKIINYFFTS